MIWQPALYEQSVIERLLQFQFHDYVKQVQTTTCQAELKRLLASGPPIYLEDKHALPLACPESDTHVCRLYYSSSGQQRDAVLNGALQGADRQALWDDLQKFVVVEGKEEGDDDDNDDQVDKQASDGER
jgi:hypothetical protein